MGLNKMANDNKTTSMPQSATTTQTQVNPFTAIKTMNNEHQFSFSMLTGSPTLLALGPKMPV